MMNTEIDYVDIGLDITDIGQRMVEESIHFQYPDWSVGERKAAIFERIYRTDFSADGMALIKASIIAFHQSKKA